MVFDTIRPGMMPGWQLLVAVFLAVMFTQTAFIGHDAGHQQISGSKRVNNLLGRLHGNLLVGLGYGWCSSPRTAASTASPTTPPVSFAPTPKCSDTCTRSAGPAPRTEVLTACLRSAS